MIKQRLAAILFIALLPLSQAPAQHRDTCNPSRAMLLTGLSQYQRELLVKQTYLQYAMEAPTENLWREMKNKDVFVRWAASVEINRRWKLEKATMKPQLNTPVQLDRKSPLLKGIAK